jgi:hypothetical protein
MYKWKTHGAVDAGQEFAVKFTHGVGSAFHLLLRNLRQLACINDRYCYDDCTVNLGKIVKKFASISLHIIT